MSLSPGHNILIVDDSATTRAFLRRAIGMAGIAVANTYEAADGKRALELMDGCPVDIVLADLHMPEMDGEEMTRRILQNPARKGIAVIIISADPDQRRIQGLLEQGVKGYIAKPFTPESLRKILSRVIGDDRQ